MPPTALRSSSAVAVCVALLSLAACGRERTIDIPAGAAPQIELLDAGAEPRRTLRFAPQPETVQTAGMTRRDPATQRAQTMTVRAEVTSTEADGSFRYDFDVRYEAQDVDLSGRGHVGPRGQHLGGAVVVPAGASPALEQALQGTARSLSQVSVALPDAAVGVGARWRVVSQMQSDGMDVAQTVTYAVQAIDGAEVTLQADIEQHGSDQEVRPPGAGPEQRIHIDTFERRGEATVRLSLERPLPLRHDARMDVDLRGERIQGERSQPFEHSATMVIEMRDRSLPAADAADGDADTGDADTGDADSEGDGGEDDGGEDEREAAAEDGTDGGR